MAERFTVNEVVVSSSLIRRPKFGSEADLVRKRLSEEQEVTVRFCAEPPKYVERNWQN